MGITEEDKDIAKRLECRSDSALLSMIESGIKNKHSTDSVTLPCGDYSVAVSHAEKIERLDSRGKYSMEIESVPYLGENDVVKFFTYLHVMTRHNSHS